MATAFDTEVEAPELESVASLAEAVVFRVPGCSDVMVRKALQNAYRDFCSRSCALRGRHCVVLENGRREYPIRTMSHGSVVAVAGIGVRFSEEFGRRLHRGECSFDAGTSVLSVGRHLLPPKGGDYPQITLDVETVEAPRLGDEHAPAWFVQAHGDAIASGALADLYAMANRPWSDPQQAVQERAKYENAIGSARYSYCTNNGVAGGPNPEEIL